MDIYKKLKRWPKYSFFWLGILVILILATFWQLPKTFYQQDEWLGLGQILEQGWSHITFGLSPLQILFGDGRPLTRVLGVLFFRTFPLDALSLSIYSISFHITNTFLVFFISRKLLKYSFFAFIAASFFAVNSVSHQAVTWFGASFGTQPAGLTTLLAVYLFLNYLDTRKKLLASGALILAILSLYFKESGIFLFLFLPLLPFIFGKKLPFRKYAALYLPLIIFAICFGLFRLVEMVFLRSYMDTTFAGSTFLQVGSQNVFATMATRAIFYPLTSLSLIFWTPPMVREIAFMLHKYYYAYITERSDLVVLTVILDIVALIGTAVIGLVLYFVVKQNRQVKTIVTFSLLLFVLSILPYVVIEKQYAYMEPRYYYIPAVGASILLGSVAAFAYEKYRKNSKVLFTGVVILALLLFFHVRTVWIETNQQVLITQERKQFLRQLATHVPTLKRDTNIFLVTGDTPWLVEGNRTPFQHGFGYSILVLYKESGKIPTGLLSQGALFALGEEGYWEKNNLQFGYFWNKEHMEKVLIENNISQDKVIALYYNKKQGKLYNYSDRLENIPNDKKTY